MALLIPTTRPRLSSSGPPLLPASRQASTVVQESDGGGHAKSEARAGLLLLLLLSVLGGAGAGLPSTSLSLTWIYRRICLQDVPQARSICVACRALVLTHTVGSDSSRRCPLHQLPPAAALIPPPDASSRFRPETIPDDRL